MEEKFFLPIFHTLPKSKHWIHKEFFKQLQFEYRDLREHTFADYEKVWKMMEDADMVGESKGHLILTKNGRHILRQNYPVFTTKHFKFHQEHGNEYLVRFQIKEQVNPKSIFERIVVRAIEKYTILLLFLGIVIALCLWIGKGLVDTVVAPATDRIERELDGNMKKNLDEALSPHQ